MKRIVAVILLVLSVFTLSSCLKDTSPEEEIVGVWKYAHNEEYREYITEAITDPGAYVDLYYEFYADGTGKTYLSTDDNEMTFTYTYDGETLTITNKDGSFDTPAKLKGNVLSVYAGDGEYLDLKRQK
ncbi:MAG: hypothetical protein E7647_03300 [Ruminococcaceae bacterium]|nr:hypothetical protein [Oscillospiraceae bacterium]